MKLCFEIIDIKVEKDTGEMNLEVKVDIIGTCSFQGHEAVRFKSTYNIYTFTVVLNDLLKYMFGSDECMVNEVESENLQECEEVDSENLQECEEVESENIQEC